MSSLCWSLPHLLTCSPPQHEAQSGQHDLLQDDALFQSPYSRQAALKNRSRTSIPSGRNPRNTAPKRSKHQYLTVPQNRILFDRMLDFEWMVNLLWGDRSVKFTEQNKDTSKTRIWKQTPDRRTLA